MAIIAINKAFAGLKKYIMQTIIIKGIPSSLISVQNGEQPNSVNPEQSSVEARKPSGIETSNNPFAVTDNLSGNVWSNGLLTSASKFIAAIRSDAATRIEKGIAKSHGISIKKSIVKRISKIAAIKNATDNRARCILSMVTTIISAA